MQHNFWISALELAGIWTREEAEYVSNEMRKQIHSERYVDAFNTLKSVLDQGKFTDLPLVSKLENDLADVKAELEKLKAPAKQNKKVVVKP